MIHARWDSMCPHGSVVRAPVLYHVSRQPGVESSNLSGGRAVASFVFPPWQGPTSGGGRAWRSVVGRRSGIWARPTAQRVARRGARRHVIPYGLVARIPGFHPGGSGSIPGTGNSFGSCEDVLAYRFVRPPCRSSRGAGGGKGRREEQDGGRNKKHRRRKMMRWRAPRAASDS